jgi:phage gpG-like protein
VGVKNGLDADQVSELEPAIEDVCLGLVTQKDLPQNIASQVGIDIALARKIAGDTLTEILDPFMQDINFARQYKLEMDERISNEKSKQGLDGLPDAGSLRAQILNENKAKIGSDEKMAAFFNKKPENTIENESEINTDEYYGEPEDEEEEIKNDLGASNFIVKEKEDFEDLQNIKTGSSSGPVTFSQIINKTIPTTTSSNDGNTAMVRFEQELAVLTQAINSLVKTTPTGKDFNLKSFEEISSQIGKIQKEISDIKMNQEEINKKIISNADSLGLAIHQNELLIDLSADFKTSPSTLSDVLDNFIVLNLKPIKPTVVD